MHINFKKSLALKGIMLTFLLAPIACYASMLSIDAWTRARGNYSRNVYPTPTQQTKLEADETEFEEIKRYDIQYARDVIVRGIPLSRLVSKYPFKNHSDTIILHFTNGMAIPWPVSENLPVFLAKSVKTKTGFSEDFPQLARDIPNQKDPVPLIFSGNKPIVSVAEFPGLDEGKGKKGFSPWKWIESLSGIEFIQREAYFNQFDVTTARITKDGFKVFETRCHFCHGVRGVGAEYGWDFVRPIPLTSFRSKKGLYSHVSSVPYDALERGRRMPAQPSVTVSESNAVWEWIRAVSTATLRDYLPVLDGQ